MNDLLPEAPWEYSSRETDFMDSARCKDFDPSYFDTSTRTGVTARLGSVRTRSGRIPRFAAIALAKAICSDCPVSGLCLSFAVSHQIEEGIWGGLLPDERLDV